VISADKPGTSGRYRAAGALRSTRPFSASFSTAAAAKFFEIEQIG